MLSYRHAFHAGNHPDVLKHSVLALIVAALKRKDTPFCAIDTHAGAGRYDLYSREARKTGEYEHGITRILERTDAPELLEPYLGVITALNEGWGGGQRFYPGSPRVVRALMRPDDRLVVCELHTTDQPLLAREFGRDRQVTVHAGDGFALLKGLVPPLIRRGLVLMDPSYEVKSDYEAVVAALADAYKRWATGVYVIWYPVLARAAVNLLQKRVVETGIRRILQAELTVMADDAEGGLKGSGLLIINPPFALDRDLKKLLPWLHTVLDETGEGRAGVRWLVGE
ncbi:MAG: 23S rRNA (adenine(2030)-N(6))-methyltransferase RlmJ [Gammaproteobacteria bacterium]|nr:23S rRNA (adenine(2030)-N(6))-methyltransferase RlmJ [Gammaproteobacteria bacterium]MBI5616718.1 23S rRNA (adenine(2030)-N(6))-methyltransferase RlmJ [Gammaproteobacteria bacterium]